MFLPIYALCLGMAHIKTKSRPSILTLTSCLLSRVRRLGLEEGTDEGETPLSPYYTFNKVASSLSDQFPPYFIQRQIKTPISLQQTLWILTFSFYIFPPE